MRRMASANTGAAEMFILKRKSDRLDQVQPGKSIDCDPADVSGVLRDLRFKKNNIEQGGLYPALHVISLVIRYFCVSYQNIL